MTGLILIDPQKAFYTTDHEILLKKMVHLQFWTQSIMWFKSYLTNRTFLVNVEKACQIQGNLNAVSPRVLSWDLSCSFCVSMTCLLQSAVKCYCMLKIYMYTCLVFKDKDLDIISDKLNTEFNKLCDWFVDNKLSIHFGEDKTKSIFFSGKNRPRDDKLKISRGRTEVAQHKEINYLGCLFDEKCTRESMALKVI